MSSSGLSSLSPAESIETDDELLVSATAQSNIDRYFKNASPASPSPPPKRKRPASPPHEYVLADNQDIAFIVMFRARFSDAFPRSLPQFGPQDIERGVVDSLPDDNVEKLLCALIGLVLNRKKDVEKGHYTRALEEAVQTNTHQWPREWEGKNPLHGGKNFNNMDPTQRLNLMKALIFWALNTSDAIQAIIKDSYKQQRQEDDLNQPLSVQSWGRDGEKRRYWLIEGRDDTHFRLYRESNPALKTSTWWSVADSIPSIRQVADKLLEDGSQAAKRLHDRVNTAIARFEAGEEKRKRREYRLARKAQFSRPDPGFSLYEGRTRGKRIRYTFSDDEADGSDALSTRRSTRQSGVSTPAEPAGPTFTASGRQVRSRVGGMYGETMHSGQQSHQPAVDGLEAGAAVDDGLEDLDNVRPLRESRSHAQTNGRSTRAGRAGRAGYDTYGSDEESDAVSTADEWNGGNDDDEADDDMTEDKIDVDEDSDMSDIVADDEDDTGKSLIVSLKIPPSRQEKLQSMVDSAWDQSVETQDTIEVMPVQNDAKPNHPSLNGAPAPSTTEASHGDSNGNEAIHHPQSLGHLPPNHASTYSTTAPVSTTSTSAGNMETRVEAPNNSSTNLNKTPLDIRISTSLPNPPSDTAAQQEQDPAQLIDEMRSVTDAPSRRPEQMQTWKSDLPQNTLAQQQIPITTDASHGISDQQNTLAQQQIPIATDASHGISDQRPNGF